LEQARGANAAARTGKAASRASDIFRYAGRHRKEAAMSRRAAAVFALLAVSVATEAALAEIRCKESFQVVAGQLIETPWCEDANLAEVARAYGTKVTAREIRNNPNLKQQLCRFIGYDLRVKDTCAGYRYDGRSR
jgi:hypothetical protein